MTFRKFDASDGERGIIGSDGATSDKDGLDGGPETHGFSATSGRSDPSPMER
jgi:hypothetical protein